MTEDNVVCGKGSIMIWNFIPGYGMRKGKGKDNGKGGYRGNIDWSLDDHWYLRWMHGRVPTVLDIRLPEDEEEEGQGDEARGSNEAN